MYTILPNYRVTWISTNQNYKIMTTLVFRTNECCICFEPIAVNNNCTTRCGHTFCLNCMIQSLKMNTTCPTCRTDLDERPDISSDSDIDMDDDGSREYPEQYLERIRERIHDSEGMSVITQDEDDYDDDEDTDDTEEDDNSTYTTESGLGIEVETVVDEFVKHGYDLKDAMSILITTYSKTDPKYTPEYIISLEDNFNKLFERVIKEAKENRNMAYEDDDSARTINLLRQEC